VTEPAGTYKSIYLARRNPSVLPEDWPRTWRSHPRTVAQIPGIGAAIGAAIDSINYCARIRQPVLDGAPFDPPGVSRDYDGVAVVASASEDLHRIGDSRESQAEVIADEVRVFGAPVDEFSMRARELLVLGGAPSQAAVVRFLARKPGVSPEAFLARLAGRQAELARAAVAGGKLDRYVQNAVVAAPPPGYPFDAITEAWFPTPEAAARGFVDPPLTALADDLTAFCDMGRSVTMLTEVIYRVPRE
jgi:hypothetical protein